MSIRLHPVASRVTGGGRILIHGIPGAHEWIEHVAHGGGAVPRIGRLLETILPILLDGLAGVLPVELCLPWLRLQAGRCAARANNIEYECRE